MQTSDTSRLFGVGSGGTSYYGGPTVVSLGTFPGTVPQRHHWVEEVGVGVTGASGTTTVTYPNSGFSGVPFLVATPISDSPGRSDEILTISTPTATSALIYVVIAGTAVGISGVSFYWRSLGSRVL